MKQEIEEWKELLYRRFVEQMYAKGINLDDERIIAKPVKEHLEIPNDLHRTVEKEIMTPEVAGLDNPIVAGININSCSQSKANETLMGLDKGTKIPSEVLKAFHVLLALAEWENILRIVEKNEANLELLFDNKDILNLMKGICLIHLNKQKKGEEIISDSIKKLQKESEPVYLPFIKRGLIEIIFLRKRNGKGTDSLLALYESLDKKCPYMDMVKALAS